MTLQRIYVLFVLEVPTQPRWPMDYQQIRMVMVSAIAPRNSGSSSAIGPASSPRRSTLSWPMWASRCQDSAPVPAGELLHRTVRAHDQSRTH